MKRMFSIGWCLCIAGYLFGQAGTTGQASGLKQCSAIRELIFGANQPKFGRLLGDPVRSSHGYQTMGSWKFETERFETTIMWPDATRCFIEHSTETTDSTALDNWQYIAEFTAESDPLKASRAMKDLLLQMEGCHWPLNDSLVIDLKPVNPAELPPSLPEGLADAYILVLPEATGQSKQMTIMVGLEKLRKGYRPVLMVEALAAERR
jgi:hypothetical protein